MPGRPSQPAMVLHWGSRHEAWQRAASTHAASAGKEPLPLAVLVAIAGHRARALGALREVLLRNPAMCARITALQVHPRDTLGRNWNAAPAARGSTWPRMGDEASFQRLVDVLRDQFDLV